MLTESKNNQNNKETSINNRIYPEIGIDFNYYEKSLGVRRALLPIFKN